MVDAVYKRDDIYKGPFLHNASELQVGFADGYRVSWQTTLGGSPPGIVYPNMKKWCGDHGGYDYKQTSGVLISSRPLATDVADIMDIAPTVLKYFGVPIPVGYRWQAALLRRRGNAEPVGGRVAGVRLRCSALLARRLVAGLAAQTRRTRGAQTEALARRAADRLQALQREADRLAAEERTLLSDLRKLEVERQIKVEELKRVERDAAKVAGELDATRRRE